jgi:hypothetical protein
MVENFKGEIAPAETVQQLERLATFEQFDIHHRVGQTEKGAPTEKLTQKLEITHPVVATSVSVPTEKSQLTSLSLATVKPAPQLSEESITANITKIERQGSSPNLEPIEVRVAAHQPLNQTQLISIQRAAPEATAFAALSMNSGSDLVPLEITTPAGQSVEPRSNVIAWGIATQMIPEVQIISDSAPPGLQARLAKSSARSSASEPAEATSSFIPAVLIQKTQREIVPVAQISDEPVNMSVPIAEPIALRTNQQQPQESSTPILFANDPAAPLIEPAASLIEPAASLIEPAASDSQAVSKLKRVGQERSADGTATRNSITTLWETVGQNSVSDEIAIAANKLLGSGSELSPPAAPLAELPPLLLAREMEPATSPVIPAALTIETRSKNAQQALEAVPVDPLNAAGILPIESPQLSQLSAPTRTPLLEAAASNSPEPIQLMPLTQEQPQEPSAPTGAANNRTIALDEAAAFVPPTPVQQVSTNGRTTADYQTAPPDSLSTAQQPPMLAANLLLSRPEKPQAANQNENVFVTKTPSVLTNEPVTPHKFQSELQPFAHHKHQPEFRPIGPGITKVVESKQPAYLPPLFRPISNFGRQSFNNNGACWELPLQPLYPKNEMDRHTVFVSESVPQTKIGVQSQTFNTLPENITLAAAIPFFAVKANDRSIPRQDFVPQPLTSSPTSTDFAAKIIASPILSKASTPKMDSLKGGFTAGSFTINSLLPPKLTRTLSAIEETAFELSSEEPDFAYTAEAKVESSSEKHFRIPQRLSLDATQMLIKRKPADSEDDDELDPDITPSSVSASFGSSSSGGSSPPAANCAGNGQPPMLPLSANTSANDPNYDPDHDHDHDHAPILDERRIYRVCKGDSFTLIAERRLGSRRFAPLLLELNRSLITVKTDGKIILLPGTYITLPNRADITQYDARGANFHIIYIESADESAEYLELKNGIRFYKAIAVKTLSQRQCAVDILGGKIPKPRIDPPVVQTQIRSTSVPAILPRLVYPDFATRRLTEMSALRPRVLCSDSSVLNRGLTCTLSTTSVNSNPPSTTEIEKTSASPARETSSSKEDHLDIYTRIWLNSVEILNKRKFSSTHSISFRSNAFRS